MTTWFLFLLISLLKAKFDIGTWKEACFKKTRLSSCVLQRVTVKLHLFPERSRSKKKTNTILFCQTAQQQENKKTRIPSLIFLTKDSKLGHVSVCIQLKAMNTLMHGRGDFGRPSRGQRCGKPVSIFSPQKI